MRVMITVQNAVDNAYVSYVFADFVQEPVYGQSFATQHDRSFDQNATKRETLPILYLSDRGLQWNRRSDG